MKKSPKWDERFLRIAREVATWSKDPSRKIGAVIVGEQDQIISQGFNGFPRGVNDTAERYNNREDKYKLVVHAEANAIYNAINSGAAIRGSTIYVTGLPVCHECAKVIIQTGIKRVVMDTQNVETKNGQIDWTDSNKLTEILFNEAGIEYTFKEKE